MKLPRQSATLAAAEMAVRSAIATWFLVLAVAVLASCGASPARISARASSILNGEATAPGELAAVGALVHDGSGAHDVFCTGTLIGDVHVLTAAHCLGRVPAGASLGFFAGDDFGANGSSADVIPVVARHAYPEFVDDPPDTLAVYRDIAVVQIARRVINVAPVRLVRPAEVPQLVSEGAGALIVGFGMTDAAVSSSKGVKRKGVTTIGQVGEGEFWALGSPAPQRCAGDSGGPTFGDLDTGEGFDWRLIGVASRAAQGCQDGSAETRVDRYLDWLHEVAMIPCGSGKSAPCAAGPLASIGEPCERHEECGTGLCAVAVAGQPSACAQPCVGPGDPCPAGSACTTIGAGRLCWVEPSAGPDPPTASPPQPPDNEGSGSGCALAGDEPVALDSAWASAMVLCAGLLLRRRVRTVERRAGSVGRLFCSRLRGARLLHARVAAFTLGTRKRILLPALGREAPRVRRAR